MKRKTKPKQKYRDILNPVGFDPTIYLDGDLQEHADAARLFIHVIADTRWKNRTTIQSDGLVPLMMKELRKFFPHGTEKLIIENLVKNKAVVRDGSFRKSDDKRPGRARRYGIEPSLFNGEWKTVRIPESALRKTQKNSTAKRRPAKGAKQNSSNSERPLLEIHKYLLKKQKGLKIDCEKTAIANRDQPPSPDASIYDDSKYQIVRHQSDLARKHQGKRDNYGRFHYPLTQLPKGVRRCLSYQGRPIVEIDVIACQPYLIGILYLMTRRFEGLTEVLLSLDEPEQFRLETPAIKKIVEQHTQSTTPPPPTPNTHTTNPPFPPYIVPLFDPISSQHSPTNGFTSIFEAYWCRSIDDLPEDVQNYFTDLRLGRFYEELMKTQKATNRGEFKETLFSTVYFGRKADMENSHVGRAFKARYPTIFQFIAELKSSVKRKPKNSKTGIKNGRRVGYKRSSRLAQALESSIMTRILCKFRDEKPNAFLGLVHDSVLVTVDDAETIKRLMNSEFSLLGPVPRFKISVPPDL